MASIQQKQLFVWQEIEELGDLERLVLALQNLPDKGKKKMVLPGKK